MEGRQIRAWVADVLTDTRAVHRERHRLSRGGSSRVDQLSSWSDLAEASGVMGADVVLTSGRCSVVPSERAQARPERRARRRTDLATVEILETRDLMAFTSLGFSLPNLIVSGQASHTAAWKGSIGITATVQNIGASTTTEPISQAPGSTSTADAPSSTVSVFLTKSRHSNAGAVDIGSLTVPALSQNNLEQVSGTLTLPSMPAGFNAKNGHYFIRLVANGTSTAFEGNVPMSVSKPIPITIIGTALPEVISTALYVPPTMQPGDTIAPVINLANIGTADTSTQGTLQVALVASTTPDFNLGSSIIQIFKIPNIPVSPVAASTSSILTNSSGVEIGTLTTSGNSAVITPTAVTLPASPNGFYIGVVVDPYGAFNELSVPSNLLEVIHVVGPAINGLPPAGVLSAPLTGAFPGSASGNVVGVSSGSSSIIG